MRTGLSRIVGDNVRRVMQARRYSARELLERARVPRREMQALLMGDANSTLDTVDAIARALDVASWKLYVADAPLSLFFPH